MPRREQIEYVILGFEVDVDDAEAGEAAAIPLPQGVDGGAIDLEALDTSLANGLPDLLGDDSEMPSCDGHCSRNHGSHGSTEEGV